MPVDPPEHRHLAELHELASARGVPRFRTLRRQDLIKAIAAAAPEAMEEGVPAAAQAPSPAEPEPSSPEPTLEDRAGVLDLVPDGYGFMRVEALSRSDRDVYVSRSQIRALGLRSGDEIEGTAYPRDRSDRYQSLAEVTRVNGRSVEEHDRDRPLFSALSVVPPRERLSVIADQGDHVGRMVDLLVPLAKGQRCLIAAPPGAGATVLLGQLGRALVRDMTLTPMAVLVDARPEEVTEWGLDGEIVVHATDSAGPPEAHVRLAELALERAKRLVEQGSDVVLLLDSITRLARAHRLARMRSRGRPGTARRQEAEDGVEAAVGAVKSWFASARNTEGHGSLTTLATVHSESQSQFEELVHDSVADAATAQLRLDLQLARAGLFPALDVARSGSHDEEALRSSEEEEALRRLRQALLDHLPAEAWRLLAEKIRETASNRELLLEL